MLLSPCRSPPKVRRTTSHADAAISPFLLDGTTLHPSPSPSLGTWLHTPVTLYPVATRTEALARLRLLSALRHPNLEALLGAVVPPSSKRACVLTEQVRGPSLRDVIRGPTEARRRFVQLHGGRVALHVARALVYLHRKAKIAHGSVCAEAVRFDAVRVRAVLLVCGEEGSGRRRESSFAGDVRDLGLLVREIFEGAAEGKKERKGLPNELADVVRRCLLRDLRSRPTVESVCQALTDYFGDESRSGDYDYSPWKESSSRGLKLY